MVRWFSYVAHLTRQEVLSRWSGFILRLEDFGVSSVLVRTLCVTLVAANHGRSLHRPRPPRYLANLTLYEQCLLAALGKFPVEPLKARLLDIQSASEGVEALDGSVLKAALELAHLSDRGTGC